MKKIITKFIGLLNFIFISTLFLFSFLSFTSCGEDSGLGATIDTKSPSLSIDYPEAGLAIRDSFIFAGSCEDDKSISKVIVTVKSLDDGDRAADSYLATLAYNMKSWSIELNEYDESNSSYYNGWKYPDGNYELSATAYDKAGNNSGTYSRTIEIDNTPPVFVISNPGVVASRIDSEGQAQATGLSASAYGSIFTIDGTISDNHAISYMDVKIFDSEGNCLSSESYNEEEIPYYREEDISTAGGSSVQIAQSGNTRYSQLHPEESGTVNYYAQITLTDSTKCYKNPPVGSSRTADQLKSDDLGNATSTVYLYDDVYSSLMSSKKGMGLSAADLKNILSGLATNESALTILNKNALDTSKSTEDSAMANKLFFSLNPEANPSYNVNGFEFGFGDDDTIQTASTGNTVSVTITAGLDNININPEVVKVWMKEVSPKPTDEDSLKAELVSLESKVSALEKAEAVFTDAIHADGENAVSKVSLSDDSSWTLIYDYSANNTRGASVSTKTFSVTLPEGIQLEKYYILGITGYDAEDVVFAQNTIYGFEGNTAGVPPTITYSTPDNLTVWKDFTSPSFTGQATISTTSLYLTELSASVTLTDERNNTVIGETYSDSMTCEIIDNEKVWSEAEKGALSWNAVDKTWKFDLSKLSALQTFYEENASNGIYWLATLVVSGTSSSGHKGEATLSIHIDTVSPVVAISSLTPSVKGSEYFDENDTNIYLNGTINLKASIEEQNLLDEDTENSVYPVYFDIWASSDLTKTLSAEDSVLSKLALSANLGKVYSLSKDIDTAAITDLFKSDSNSDPKIQFEYVLTAKDKAGNFSTYSSKNLNSGKNFVICQETDRPKISLGNASSSITSASGVTVEHNLFGTTTNNKLQVTFSDDDSVNTIFIKLFDSEGNPLSDDKVNSVYSLNPFSASPKKTTYSIYYTLPETEGLYQVRIDAYDGNLLSTELTDTNTVYQNTVGPFFVAVDSGAPSIEILTPISGSYQNGSLSASGNVTKREGVTITGKLTQNDVEVSSASISAVTISETAANKLYSWSGSLTLPEDAAGTYQLTYTALDSYGQSSSTYKVFNVDTVAPVWKEESFKIKNAAYSADSWYNAKTLKFQGEYTEEVSGVSEVLYVINPQDSEGNDLAQDSIDWSSAESFTSPDGKTFSQNLGDFTVGESNVIYFKAVDNAGNKSDVVKKTLKIDTSQPTITSDLSGTVLSNKVLAIDVSGKVSDDASGVASVVLNISGGSGESAINKDVTGIVSTSANEDGSYNWNASIPSGDGSVISSLENGTTYTVKATVTDKAGNSLPASIFNIAVDTTIPEIASANLTDSSSITKVYKKDVTTTENDTSVTTTTYYINNSKPETNNHTFTINGTATDNRTLKSVSLNLVSTVDSTKTESYEITENPYVWSFSGLDMSSWSGGARATITALDSAGNESESMVLNIVFDTTAPEGLHDTDTDAKGKDLYFRLGDSANGSVSDVGGKYSAGTYGNDSTIKIRGNFKETGSGTSLIYYKLYNETAPTEASIRDFFDDYENNKDGYFSPLTSAETKSVSVNKTDGTSENQDVDSTFKTNITGFTEGDNYLVLVAVDNVGNAALDTMMCTVGETSLACYSINVDTTSPVIEKESESFLTNGSGSGDDANIVIEGYASDASAGVASVAVTVTVG
ncbi:MAG: hypothetical protein K5873_11495, partial [Treponema sp.]|nr:hypothetical protein [Treponema sp.]